MLENDFITKNIILDESLSKFTWFNVGGSSKYYFKPKSEIDLINFFKKNKFQYKIFPLGAGSNTLIRDKGLDGITIHFQDINKIEIDDNGIITAGAGAMDAQVSRFARDHNRGGLEFLIGIPGSIGGGVRMNSGAYGSDFKKILIDVKAVNLLGKVKVFNTEELGLSYRSSRLCDSWFFLEARFKSFMSEKIKIQKKMKEIIFNRKESQPTGVKTGGSTFMNKNNFKAWKLIQEAGCRGLAHGGAKISEKHCNFIINENNATANDIETLGELVREKVFLKTGYKLDWEIKIIGKK